jgi:hypothetical protein
MSGEVSRFLSPRVSGSRAFVVVMSVALMSGVTSAGVMQTASFNDFHENHGDNFSSDGKFVLNNGRVFSGTLIEPRWVLTTAHTVDAAEGMTFNLRGREVAAEAWYTHDTWERDPFFDGNDIALVHLDEPMPKADTASLSRSNRGPGRDTWVAGYGATGTGATGPVEYDGERRAGENRAEARLFGHPRMWRMEFDIEPDHPLYDGPPFDIVDPEEDSPLPLEYLPANQDAGGGVFFKGELVGVPSSVFGLFDGETDYSYKDTVGMTRVSPWVEWIESVMAFVNAGNTPANAYTGLPDEPLFTRDQAINLTTAQINEGSALIGDLAPLNLESGFFLGPLGGAVSVPEPGTAALLLPAAGWLALRRRRPRPAPRAA